MKPGARDRWSSYRLNREQLATRVQAELDLLDHHDSATVVVRRPRE
jgi:hypothetical protein